MAVVRSAVVPSYVAGRWSAPDSGLPVYDAVTHEGALRIADVLARRVRLLIESPDAGASAAPEVAAIMAPLLGWHRRRRTEEIRRYQALATESSAALHTPVPSLSPEISIPA